MKDEKIKTYIIDSSFVLCFLLPDENASKVDLIFQSYSQGALNFLSCPLLHSEVCNGLVSAVRRKRITQEMAQKLVESFLALRIPFCDIDNSLALDLVLHTDLSFYDATYLSLAQEKQLPLLTLDEKLKVLT